MMQAARVNIHAFAPLYERYFPRIYAYCLRRVNNEQEAEDLASQIFTRALTNLDTYRGGIVAAWLFRIAHNLVVNHYRSQRAQISLDDTDLTTDQPEPLENILQAEEAQIISSLVATLSDDQQDLVALKLVGQLTSQEIGEVVGKSAGAVRVELHRILNQLRELYEEAQHESRKTQR